MSRQWWHRLSGRHRRLMRGALLDVEKARHYRQLPTVADQFTGFARRAVFRCGCRREWWPRTVREALDDASLV